MASINIPSSLVHSIRPHVRARHIAIVVPKPPSPMIPRNQRKQGSQASQQSSKCSDTSPWGSSKRPAMSHGPETRSGSRNGSRQGSDAGTGGKSNTKSSKNTSNLSRLKASNEHPSATRQTPTGSKCSPKHDSSSAEAL